MGTLWSKNSDDNATELKNSSSESSRPTKKKKSKKGKKDKGVKRGRTKVLEKDDLTLKKEYYILNKDNKFTDDYKLKERLGEGAFGIVGKWEHLKSKKIRAVKMLSKKKLDKEELEALSNEVEIVSKLDHPNIVKMYEQYEDSKFLYIVTEWINGGELFDELLKRKKFTEKDCAIIIKQLLSALSHIHAKSIAHKDLKPENIMLEKKRDINSVKLIDFGTAQKFQEGEKMDAIIGTPYYVAPEVLRGSYDEMCDIWGLGVIMYILLCGTPPFNGGDDNEIMMAVKKGTFQYNSKNWKNISTEAKDLINKMIVKSPSNRITAQDALDHEWFEKVLDEEFESRKLSGALKGLKEFKARQKMQQAALGYIISQLATKEDTHELDEAFK